ncbi:MAG TPA: hypothetical protein VIR38_00150, partial [Thalassobaculum sp.]
MTAPFRRPEAQGPDAFDTALLLLYLLGIYLGLDIRLTASVPVPTVLSGLAGAVMLLKHMHRLRDEQTGALLLVVVLFLGSIMVAADAGYLRKRSTGLVQLTYSFIIGYGLYVTMLLYQREVMARIFGWFCVVIVVGCALETHFEPFRTLSDTVRGIIFDFGVYVADRRDIMLYGKIRPKLFTSEPSAVTFGFTLFAFCWYVLSEWRWKLVGYGMLFTAAFLLMRGPTLILGLTLLVPYEIFLAPRRETPRGSRYNLERGTLAIGAAGLLTIVALAVGLNFYDERIQEIRQGTDPSFFSRITAPFLVAVEVVRQHPIAGIGLTAEDSINGLVKQVYAQGGNLVSDFEFESAKHALTNYFWTHWIYLGLVWGVVILAGITFYLRSLKAPSVMFCWSVWTILGQASGAYVSPKTWTVMYLA